MIAIVFLLIVSCVLLFIFSACTLSGRLSELETEIERLREDQRTENDWK